MSSHARWRPRPALLVAPKHEPPWAVLRTAGAPEILGRTAWAGVGASRTSWLLSLEPQARRGRAGCSVSSRGWHAAMGVGVSHRSSVLGAVQPGGKVTALGASEPTTRPAWTRCVMRWGNTGWVPRTTEVAFLAVLGAGDQRVCHGWAGTDPMGAFEVAQPCGGCSENTPPAWGQVGQVGPGQGWALAVWAPGVSGSGMHTGSWHVCGLEQERGRCPPDL